MDFSPRLATVSRFEERSLAARYPTMIPIEKVHGMQPGHRAGVLARPGRAVGRRQKAEGRKQKAEGRKQTAVRHISDKTWLEISR
jgi:hypothetical protein